MAPDTGTAPVSYAVKSIEVHTVDHNSQRYDTLGDWSYSVMHEKLHIYVSDIGDWRMNMAVALHEATEGLLCIAHGVDQDAVTQYDVDHPESPEPGEEPHAPYNREHAVGDIVERLFIQQADLKWHDYEAKIDTLPNWNPLR